MKSFHSLSLAAVSLAALTSFAQAQLPPVAFTESAIEFTGHADVDGNALQDIIIVDKVSGSFRIIYQTAAGVFVPDEPKASGIGKVMGVTAGHLFGTTRDALAVTAPEANRINILAPTLGAAVAPLSVFVAPVGPTTLVAANLVGTVAVDDLWVGSALNSAPNPSSFDQFVNNPAGTFSFNVNRHVSAESYDTASVVVAKTGLVGTIAYMQRGVAADTLRLLSSSEVGAPVRLTVSGLPDGTDYVIAPFGNGPLASILTWKPGDTAFVSRTITEAVVGTFALAPFPRTYFMPFPIGQLVAVPATATQVKLLVISPNGALAAYFDFDGQILSAAPLLTLAAPGGESFTGAVAVPGYAGFQLLRGTAGDQRTTTARSMKWNPAANRYDDVGGSSFAPMGKRSGAGNVMLFSGEPLVSPTATLLSRLNARDWSSVPPASIASITVTGELNGAPTQGLRSPGPVALGAPPVGTTHVLLNQQHPQFSFLSTSPASGVFIGEPRIMPEAGAFARTVQISFNAPPGMVVKFRDAGAAWSTFTAPSAQPSTGPGDAAYEAWWTTFSPLLRFKNTVIEYYGQLGTQRSPIKTAAFTFTAPPATLSSLGDGVPDYVKLGLHYNPLLPPPGLVASESGSFLNRLLGGVSDKRRLSAGAVDLYVRPLSLNGYSNTVVNSQMAGTMQNDQTPAPGNALTAYDVGGALLAVSDLAPPVDKAPGLRSWPSAFGGALSSRLSTLPVDGTGAVAILGTSANFAIGGQEPLPAFPSAIGREIVALTAIPSAPLHVYQRAYTGGADAAEAALWLAAATNFYASSPVPVVTQTVDSLDTMATLLFERWLLLRCLERNILPPSYLPPVPNQALPPAQNPNRLSVTGFRLGEAALPLGPAPSGVVCPTAAQIFALQTATPPVDAFRFADVITTIKNTLRTSSAPGVVALRAVTMDVYRISSRYANEVRGGFELPVDALRQFLGTGAVPTAYGNDLFTPTLPLLPLPGAPYSTLTDAQFASALTGMTTVLDAVPRRPYATFDLVVRADTVQPTCTILDKVGGGLRALVRADGSRFGFPTSFKLTPGSHLSVTGYTDQPTLLCGTVIEVITYGGIPAAEVTSIPVPTPLAGDNLLPDDWEMFFFGQTGMNPFSTPPGSGVSYLQLYLDGKDPMNPAAFAGIPPVINALPQQEICPSALGEGNNLVMFKFPTQYAKFFTFHLQASPDLTTQSFEESGLEFQETVPGQFEVVTPPTVAPDQFWRVGFALK
jgi:hypothetical protein